MESRLRKDLPLKYMAVPAFCLVDIRGFRNAPLKVVPLTGQFPTFIHFSPLKGKNKFRVKAKIEIRRSPALTAPEKPRQARAGRKYIFRPDFLSAGIFSMCCYILTKMSNFLANRNFFRDIRSQLDFYRPARQTNNLAEDRSKRERVVINIALCFFDANGAYHIHAGVTMLSVLENTKSRVCFHIVSQGTTAEHKKNLNSVAEKYGAQVVYYDASQLDLGPVKPFLKKLGPGTFYRLYLHRLLDLDKVIYLDCDIICNLDIAEMYELEISGFMCAAVPDGGILKHIREIECEQGKYFNAGVLLLNLAWLRANHALLEQYAKDLAGRPKVPTFGDQDILNVMARDLNYNVLYLGEKFNYFTGISEREWLDDSHFAGKIVHITSRKPWAKWSNSCIQYWKYYRLCPWGQDVFEKMSSLTADLDRLFLRQLPSKERKALRRFLDWRRLGAFGYLRKRLFKQKG
ncbi:MAG: glycosyltransferase family 8 protein [Deltaproteobacteria bacterium]|nr:glycosyltransferase family 8 protein [Deltaproteobacteria bacterium]